MRISFLRTHVAQQAQCALWAKIGCCLFLATSYRTFRPQRGQNSLSQQPSMKASEKVGGYPLLTFIFPRERHEQERSNCPFRVQDQRRINCPVFSDLRPDVQATDSQYRPAKDRGLRAYESACLTRNNQLMILPS